MKRVICISALWSVFILLCASSAGSQPQEIEGYTFIRGTTGSAVCLGRWVPSREAGRPGVCEGQWADVSQITAISARQTTEKLDQLLIVLDSIDQKLSANNLQMELLIEATDRTQAAIDRQSDKVGELMHDTISSRVDALSKRVLANETFRKELEKLKEDIRTDLKKYYRGK